MSVMIGPTDRDLLFDRALLFRLLSGRSGVGHEIGKSSFIRTLLASRLWVELMCGGAQTAVGAPSSGSQ